MYKMKCIFQPVGDILYPDCMYKIKNMYDQNRSECKNLTEMEVLETRQTEILKHLEDLKLQLTVTNKDLRLCNKPSQPNQTVTTQTSEINTHYLQDLVINANPNTIPYSILAIKKLWSKRINVTVQCFIHSSISELPQEAKDFVDTITVNDASTSDVKLHIVLIWKNILGNVEMNCSPKVCVSIYGEVNILRFLSRIGPNELNYENATHVNEIDSVLDLCYQLRNNTSLKDCQNAVQALSCRLGKTEYYCSNFSIGDIAVSSLIKQNNYKNLTENLEKWFKKVCTVGY